MSYEDNNPQRQSWQQQPEAVPASQRTYHNPAPAPAPVQQQPSYQPAPQQAAPYPQAQQGGYQKPAYQQNNGGQQGGYQKKPYTPGGGGGYNKGGGGGGNSNFKPPEPNPNAVIYKPYAAFGNTNPPQHVVEQIKQFARELETMGYTMRCGGMKDCEDIFENAVQHLKEIHLPFRDFDQKQSKFTYIHPDAKIVAGRYQVGFDGLKPGIQTFLAKNVRVLMGKDLKSPALFLITFSEDGASNLREKTARTGNAGHSIAIASDLQIPIFNLGHPDGARRLRAYIDAAKPADQQQGQPQQQAQQYQAQPQQQPGHYQQQGNNHQPQQQHRQEQGEY